MTDPTTPAPSEPPDAHEATALAADLREALRPLWRHLNAHRTLSMGKVGILSRLDRRGAMAATDLAALERISHQAVANAVRELEEMGLVSRSPDPDDRRRAGIAEQRERRRRDVILRGVTDRKNNVRVRCSLSDVALACV